MIRHIAKVSFILLASTILICACIPEQTVTQTQGVVTELASATADQNIYGIETQTSVVTQTETIAPTMTALPATMGPDDKLSLQNAVLTPDALDTSPNIDELEFLLDHYGNLDNGPRVSIVDVTNELLLNGMCPIDCVKQVWTKLDYELVVTLSLASSTDQAENEVLEMGQNILVNYNGLDYAEYIDFCMESLPANTWIVWALDDNFRFYLGTSDGSLMLFLRGNVPGDDVTHYACILTEFARLQLKKLKMMGY